jgi:S1-C subfamily serine protease
METPFNFVATLDIVGGNSGSPIVNARGDVVGLAFDGNIHSVAGGYGYDARSNRAIGVDVRIMRLALERVYGAGSLLAEMERRR